MHLLAPVDPVDDTCRRLMNRQLTVQESRHRLARAICHGGRGQIRQAYREGQEYQLASLGLVLNAVVLSPLNDRHINFVGRHQFDFAAGAPQSWAAPAARSERAR